MQTLFQRFIKDQSGGPATEFALVGALVAVCLPAMIDMSTIINKNMKLSGGMRAGQQYALKYPTDNTGIAQAIADASNLPSSSVTVTTYQFCECNGLSNLCSGSCSYGVQLAKYINITAVYDMSQQYNYEGMPYPQTISKTIEVRIQ